MQLSRGQRQWKKRKRRRRRRSDVDGVRSHAMGRAVTIASEWLRVEEVTWRGEKGG
jgi:hypothetical protein